jgi:PAS domain S-box-containing protein
MSIDPAVVQANASVADGAKAMSSRNVSSVVVQDGEEVAGVLTERDVLKRLIAPHRDPAMTTVADVMSSPVLSIDPDYSIFSASRFMERSNCRRLVVMEDKRLLGIITQTDIFKAVRRKLQESEEENLSFLEKSEHAIYTADLDETATYVNTALVELLGVSDSSELIDRPFLPQEFWLDPQERSHFVAELEAKAFVESKEVTLVDCKGNRVYVNLSCNFTRDVHGEINGSQGILRDISADKELAALIEAKEELRESEEKFRLLSEQSLMGIAILQDGLVKYANQAASDISEYTLEDILSWSEDEFAKAIHPEDLPFVMEQADRKQSGDTDVVKHYSARIITKTGKIKWLDLYSRTVMYGRRPADLTSLVDITEQKEAEQKLKEEKATLNSIIDLNPYSIAVYDADGHYVKGNQAFLDLFGGYPPPDYSLFEDPILGEAGCSEALLGLKEGKVVRVPELWYNPHAVKPELPDCPVFVRGLNFPILDIDGNVQYIVAMHEDITEWKRAEEALADSEEKYRLLFDSAADLIAVIDTEGNVLDLSRKFEEESGYDREEMIGKSALTAGLLTKASVAKILFHLKGLLAGERTPIFEIEGVRKDGDIVPYELRAVPIEKGDKIVAVQAILRNITERKRSGEALRESEEKYRKLFEEARDGILLADAETGKIIDCNQAAAELVGRAKSELVGQPQTILHPPRNEGARVPEIFQKCLSDQVGQELETQVITKSGETREVTVKASLIELDGKQVLQGTFRDITERKRAEEELQRRAEELELAKGVAERSAAELAKAFDELNAVKKDIERFNRAAVGREMRIIEVKHEINELLEELGRAPKYNFIEGKASAPQ